MTEKERKVREILGDDFPLMEEISNLLSVCTPEVGKYYKTMDVFGSPLYFKAVEINGDAIEGYGVEGDGEYFENGYWGYIDDGDYTEITRTDFLKQVAKYAEEKLGFESGVFYRNHEGVKKIADYSPRQVLRSEKLECGYAQGIIYENGKFVGEVVKESTDWKPTMQLGYKDGKLHQKWEEVETGATEWREVKTV